MLTRIRLAWASVGHAFGAWLAPAVTLVLFANLRLLVAVAMALDPLLFPKLRSTQVRRPVVIVGNPRTGTTFLQRFLDEIEMGGGQHLWRMLYPSLTLQTVLRPFIPALEKVSPARHHATVAHDTSLLSVETDDVSVLFRYFDGFFLYGFFLAWHPDDHLPLFDPILRDTAARDFAWLDALWRRNAVWTGRDRVIAKLFSVGTRTPAFLDRFPDAQILYMVRDPVSVIPSTLSLITGVLDKRFGYWKLPQAQRDAWVARVYAGLVMILRRFHDDWVSGRIPKDRVKIVRFDRMMSDFEREMDEIAAFVDWTPTEAQRARIRQVAEKQKRYQSEHVYDVARFGLTAEQIRRDCAFVYDTFLPPLPESAG